MKINRNEVYETLKLFGDSGAHTREIADAMKYPDYRIVGFVITDYVMEGKVERVGFRKIVDKNGKEMAAQFYRVK